ncbi:unnamed protein product [Gongylonema pulchrum]|uniref:GPI transamidase component PIG-S n=1 Tax=Gongylonema pulchrum TaxID=637853 RepID=A0A183E6Z9_9BILA|nr:unnamed protein product [Gongylonema pulchrum]
METEPSATGASSSSVREERMKTAFALTAEDRAELPIRRISAVSFIIVMLVFGVPLWWQTTSTYRVPFSVFSPHQQIILPVHITVACSFSSTKQYVERAAADLLRSLSELPKIDQLRLIFKLRYEDTDEGILSKNELEKPGLFGVHVAVIDEAVWPYSGNRIYFDNDWAYVLNSVEKTELADRMLTAISDVLLDTSHLSAIVRRDLKQRMQLQEVVALSPSQQKRLIWDSAALSAHYIVQIIFVHIGINETSASGSLEDVVLNARRFGAKLFEVTELSISSEHLWDFDLTPWMKKDVQERWTIHIEDISQIVTAIERETSTVESWAPVMKFVVLDAPQSVVLLDHMGDDSYGIVVASWGAILCGGGQGHFAISQSMIGAMRVLFGLDTEIPAAASRAPMPVANWEIGRLKLRSFIDSSINAISSVAGKADQAVQLVSGALRTAQETGVVEVRRAVQGRALAESALNDKSLLALLYFPNDQKFAIYLPLFLPTLLPMFTSILALYKYVLGKE